MQRNDMIINFDAYSEEDRKNAKNEKLIEK